MNELNSEPSNNEMLGSFDGSLGWDELDQPGQPVLPPEMEGFHLCESLGTGATGTVYRSIQTKQYAVKVFSWNQGHQREIAKHEFEVGKLFSDCDSIIKVMSYYEYNSNSFILQELGEPILSFFSHEKCTLRMILQALIDISTALAYIHSKGFTHFDVKPENILIVDGRARLGDFSHCLRYIQDQEYERALGTDVFMAPEIKSGSKQSGLEDMYSLGITMYTLLMAGTLPKKRNPLESENQDCKIHSLFIHPDLMTIIQKSTAMHPCERYQAFDDFSNDIQSFMRVNNDYLDDCIPMYNRVFCNRSLPYTSILYDSIPDSSKL